jgi:hypothetical protein
MIKKECVNLFVCTLYIFCLIFELLFLENKNNFILLIIYCNFKCIKKMFNKILFNIFNNLLNSFKFFIIKIFIIFNKIFYSL